MVIFRHHNKNEDDPYDKIRHLVEVDDDILAVFSISSINPPSDLNELYIAKNAKLDKNHIESLVNIIQSNQNLDLERSLGSALGQEEEIGETENKNNFLGKIKWIVMEYERIRILKIIEENKEIFVLINSNTQLEHTVDNILGYYYDLEETPRSLF